MLIVLSGLSRLGISIERIILDCLMNNLGGKLYGIKITGQLLYEVLEFAKAEKPSLARLSPTLQESKANLDVTHQMISLQENRLDASLFHLFFFYRDAISLKMMFLQPS